MKLLKEWNDVNKMTKDIIRAFSKWKPFNLKTGNEYSYTFHSLTKQFGFPYTSTSEFAALWNCQCEATYVWKPEWSFLALAYSENMEMVAVFENANEDYMYIIIG